MRLAATLALSLFACSAPPRPTDGPPPGGGTPYPMTEPDPAVAALAADFEGSCAFARPAPPADRYATALVTRHRTAVHDSAVFATGDNRIGSIAAGERLVGEGPLVAGAGSAAGYGVVLRDGQGRVCRGYVASDDVKRERGRSK